MRRIYLFSGETYTDKLLQLRNEILFLPEDVILHFQNEKYINEYLDGAMWRVDEPYGRFHQFVMDALEEVEITCFHNTRLVNKEDIESNGLIFSDGRYLESLRKNIYNIGIKKELLDELICRVKREIDRWDESGVNHRKNQICFFYSMDYYKDYHKFMAIYGGEFMEDICLSKWGQDNIRDLKKVFLMGVPSIVEFALPFRYLSYFTKQDIARYMIEEWIHLYIRKDEVSHAYDGYCDFEIPSQNIIKIEASGIMVEA